MVSSNGCAQLLNTCVSPSDQQAFSNGSEDFLEPSSKKLGRRVKLKISRTENHSGDVRQSRSPIESDDMAVQFRHELIDVYCVKVPPLYIQIRPLLY